LLCAAEFAPTLLTAPHAARLQRNCITHPTTNAASTTSVNGTGVCDLECNAGSTSNRACGDTLILWEAARAWPPPWRAPSASLDSARPFRLAGERGDSSQGNDVISFCGTHGIPAFSASCTETFRKGKPRKCSRVWSSADRSAYISSNSSVTKSWTVPRLRRGPNLCAVKEVTAPDNQKAEPERYRVPSFFLQPSIRAE